MRKILLLIVLCLSFSNVDASSLPDFRIIRMWMNDNCSHLYVRFANRGAGISPDLYDRNIHNKPFFMVSSSKGRREFFLDEVDPNRKMTLHDGVATFRLTEYVYLEKNQMVGTMVNYGHRIEESAYGAPNHKDIKLICGGLPNVMEKPLEVQSLYIVPNSKCDIGLRLKNPGPDFLTYAAWKNGIHNIHNGLAFDDRAQSQKSLNVLDPEKNLRNPGGISSYIYKSDEFHSPFLLGESKFVRARGYWLRSNATKVYDESKMLHCGPDLTIKKHFVNKPAVSIYVKPELPKVGDNVRLRFKIVNNGTETTRPSMATLKVGGETNPKSYEVPELAPSQVFVITRTLSFKRADNNYGVRFIIDATNTNNEYNENNNEVRFRIRVTN